MFDAAADDAVIGIHVVGKPDCTVAFAEEAPSLTLVSLVLLPMDPYGAHDFLVS